MDAERERWVSFNVCPGVGPVRFRKLLLAFDSARAAWDQSEQELAGVVGSGCARDIVRFRSQFDIAPYLHRLRAEDVYVVTLLDDKYPRLLSEISDPPFVLYVKGKRSDVPWDITRAVGVVGTRRATSYGKHVTEQIVAGLVDEGYTIVSGLAYGIDAVAHKTALARGGKTIAVLGCGIDIIAPSRNAYLYRQIISEGNGAIISEMPLSLKPNKGVFTTRNRIIAGMSKGVIITEGSDISGALITASYAARQGREVFAVPGPVTSPYSKGPHILLKQGATVVEDASDVLRGLGQIPQKTSQTEYKPGSEEERLLLEILEAGGLGVDELVQQTSLTAHVVAATLSVLEVQDVVKRDDHGRYILISRIEKET